MKAPVAQQFPNATKAKPKSKRKAAPAKATPSVRRTYNIATADDDKINAVALQMSQQRGKVVSASEALRKIISAYKVKA